MDKTRQTQIKIIKTTPPVDLAETAALLDLLFIVCKQNNAYCCRLLDIGYPTWLRWNKNPPTSWYWPPIIRLAIKHVLSSAIAHRRGLTKAFQSSVSKALARIPNSQEFADEVSNMAYEERASETHLRLLLYRAGGGMFWSEIRSPAYCGGFTEQTLRKASRILGVVKGQRGYGEDKDSWWELPITES